MNAACQIWAHWLMNFMLRGANFKLGALVLSKIKLASADPSDRAW